MCAAAGEHERIGGAVRTAGEQLECPALLRVEKTFSRGGRHSCPLHRPPARGQNEATQRSEIAIPLRSTLAIKPTCRPLNDKTAPFSFSRTIAPAPNTIAAPAPAAPYTPATSNGLKMLLTVPTKCVSDAPNTRPALRPAIDTGYRRP